MQTGTMNITFSEHEDEFQLLQEVFNTMGEDALQYTHYELAAASEFSANDWKKFITDSRVRDYLESELQLMQQSAVMKMMKDIDRSKSTGQAQLLNTLVNQTNSNKVKEGPTFIYTYIPLNEEEVHAPDVQIAEGDPFKITIPDRE